MFKAKSESTIARMILIAALIFIWPGSAVADAPSPGAMQTGSLLMRMEQGYVTATLLNTDVNITVNGLVARVSVMQKFENDGSEWVEGVYVFPLPEKAAVDHMRLYVGDRYIEGEIQEKELARKAYEQARQEGKKTSLVEQQRANLFTTSVANISSVSSSCNLIRQHCAQPSQSCSHSSSLSASSGFSQKGRRMFTRHPP